MLFDCFIIRLYMRVLKLTLGKIISTNFSSVSVFSVCSVRMGVPKSSGRSCDTTRRARLGRLDNKATRPDAYDLPACQRGNTRPDRDPTASIKHGRRIFSLPHKISPLASSERFLAIFALARSLLSFLCKSLTSQVFF
jgi:hypothetical protein